MTKILFPGTFDPITKGHLDLIDRATKLFDEVYVVLMVNPEKQTLLTFDERLELMKESLSSFNNVIVDAFEGLTVQYAHEHNIYILLRGVRSFLDYEYEMQIASVNSRLNPNIETMFLLAKPELAYISSSNVKAVAQQQGNLQSFVEPHVERVVKQHINKKEES